MREDTSAAIASHLNSLRADPPATADDLRSFKLAVAHVVSELVPLDQKMIDEIALDDSIKAAADPAGAPLLAGLKSPEQQAQEKATAYAAAPGQNSAS